MISLLDELAKKKNLPLNFLAELGVSDDPRGIAITYRLPDGSAAPRQRIRKSLSAKDGFRWMGEGDIVPYGLWRLKDNAKKYLILVEGESDCWTLWLNGFPALGLPGATTAKTLKHDYLSTLSIIYIWQEPDQGGKEFVSGLNKRLYDIGWAGQTKIIAVEGYKDPSAIWIGEGREFGKLMRYSLSLALPGPIYTPPPAKILPKTSYVGKLDAEKIKKASEVPLETLVDTKNGYILCQFHKDTRPSMWVKNGYGYCFSCSKIMNSITYLRKVKGLKFHEAVNMLCGDKK